MKAAKAKDLEKVNRRQSAFIRKQTKANKFVRFELEELKERL